MKRWLPFKPSKPLQRGDTLVEVVFAIAILTSVLTTAYHMGTQAFALGIESRERTQAVNLAQQQAEELRYYADAQMASGVPNALTTNIADKCTAICSMTSGTTLTTAFSSCSGVIGSPNCHVSFTTPNDIANSKGGVGPQYPEIDAHIIVSWTSVVGNQSDQSTLEMRLADTTNFQPLDCSVAGTPGCSVDTRSLGGGGGGFTWIANGSALSSCTPGETPFGDGRDGCFKFGSVMYAWRDVNASYPLSNGTVTPTGTPVVGPANLVIFYNQCNTCNGPPPPSYSYQLTIKVMLGSTIVSTTNVSLPIPSDSTAFLSHNSSAIPLNIPSSSATIEIDWTNNEGVYVSGDPNLQINKLSLTSP